MDIDTFLNNVQHEQRLVRSKGLESLKAVLEKGEMDEAFWTSLKAGTQSMLASMHPISVLGGFLTATMIAPYCSKHDSFLEDVQNACILHLEHPEGRVRQAIGDCLETLCKIEGIQVYAFLKDALRNSIERNFERDSEDTSSKIEEDPLDSLLETTYRVTKPGFGEMRHGTEGWKALETSYRSLLKIIQGTGEDFYPFLTPDLWSLAYRGIKHMNRFVREISFFTIGAMVEIMQNEDAVHEAEAIVTVLSKGLQDDWSQVRYAASIATRTFMTEKANVLCKEKLFPNILPQMCLNRYYVADGVRLYSQETWKRVVGDNGRDFVAQFAPSFVEYYTKQCGANNHAVREAACSCIAELMTKIDKTAVENHVKRLIQALVNCFKDASWPVRDAACCAVGRCVRSFPEASRPALDELYALWLAHLADNIATVRENSAIALGDAIRAYGQEALDRILPEIRRTILEAQNQESDSVMFSGLQNVTQFGVAKARDDSDEAHTDQTMFSCGSLAPKLARGGGCMDHGFKRPKQPWEVSDGAVYFVRELSDVHSASVAEFMPSLVTLLNLSGFVHAHNLHETIWKSIPVIARSLGKRPFKAFLEDLLDPLFRSLQSGHGLEEAAAMGTMMFFSQFLGDSIFRGRLNEKQLQIYDSLKEPHAFR